DNEFGGGGAGWRPVVVMTWVVGGDVGMVRAAGVVFKHHSDAGGGGLEYQ
ncbi:hypothetical protein Tco_1001600, partial [Tanacetum coccineum]